MGSAIVLSSPNLFFIFPDLQIDDMGISRFRSAFRRSSTHESVTQVAVSTDGEQKSEIPTETVAVANSENPEVPTEDVQQGVRDVEGVTLSWTKTMLIAVFAK